MATDAAQEARAVEPAPSPPLRRHAFRAMGTAVELFGPDLPRAALDAGERTIASLERRWSRFLPASELCRLNHSAGLPVIVPAITFDLIAEALAWSDRTHGWFDPTVLHALEAAGYDRSFDDLRPDAGPAGPSAPAPGPAGVSLDLAMHAVTLPQGVGLDLGGIGKGRAADLVAERWAAEGLAGCANLGGDLRAVGVGPSGGWRVALDDPFDPDRTVAVIGITEGAIATSSTTKRTWERGGGRSHHLIDPRTGRPSTHPSGSVTVVAPTAVEAEVWAKAALVAGPTAGRALLAEAGVPALRCDAAGIEALNDMEAFLA